MIAKKLFIHGAVQGVGFRESMRRQAEQLQVGGWVRNRRDGTVEAVVRGSPPQVEQMITWARQGPRFAVVERVVVADAAEEASADNTFTILFTA